MYSLPALYEYSKSCSYLSNILNVIDQDHTRNLSYFLILNPSTMNRVLLHFVSLLTLLLGFSNLNYAAPSLTYEGDECGHVIVKNYSNCPQTVYCHEISSDNKIYKMGVLGPNKEMNVYPTADRARVYTENSSGWESTTMYTSDCKTYTVLVQHCSGSYQCHVNIENDGCKRMQLYTSKNGEWVVDDHIDVGETLKYQTDNNKTIILAYSYNEIVKTIKASCGHSYKISDNDCAVDCNLWFKNDACDEVWIYRRYSSDWSYIGKMQKGKTYEYASDPGASFMFKYSNGEIIDTWDSHCGGTYSVNDHCSTSCKVYLKNEACASVKVFLKRPGDWSYIGTIAHGVTYSHSTTNGSTYMFKYADDTIIKQWTGWCGESYTLTDACHTECDFYFKNDACHDIKAYKQEGNDWKYVGKLDKGVTYRHTGLEHTKFQFKYDDGTKVGEWTGLCDKKYVIEDDCNQACEMYFKNKACEDVFLYLRRANDWVYLGKLSKGRTYKQQSANGSSFMFKYSNGHVVNTWTGWCGESYEIKDNCAVACQVRIKNRTCGKLEILTNQNGILVSKGKIGIGEIKTLHVADKAAFIFKHEDGAHAGSWWADCGKQYTVLQECAKECDVHIKNDACAVAHIYAVNDAGSTAIGTVAKGETRTLHSVKEGTKYVAKYADGTQIGSWTSICDATYTLHDDCAQPCDGVTIAAIKIYDQETDKEVVGIGALTEGMMIDESDLPDAYYITAEVSDHVESVSLIVDSWAVCENYAPYTYPNAAHQGTDWDGGSGPHSVTIKVYAGSDCKETACAETTVNFTIKESEHPTTPTTPTCDLSVTVTQDSLDCDGQVILSAIAIGSTNCDDPNGVSGTCATAVVSSKGYVLDPAQAVGCADGVGARLWRSGAVESTFIVIDLGAEVAAGGQVCATLRLKHCLNTDDNKSNASISGSTTVDGNYSTITSLSFSNEEFAEMCFSVPNATRYVKIEDTGGCSFRVDALSTGAHGVASPSNEIKYTWINDAGDTLAQSKSVAINQAGVYMVVVQDCNGCIAAQEDINVAKLIADDCTDNTVVMGGNLALANGDTSIDICSNDGISDALEVTLSGETGAFSTWVVLDASRNIISINDTPPFDFEGKPAGLCIICHVSYNGVLGGFTVGQNANDVTGDVDFSNEISVTKFETGGPCSGGNANPEEGSIRTETRGTNTDWDMDLEVYPNPVANQLIISASAVDHSSTSDAGTIEIFSIDGQLVLRDQIRLSQQSTLDVSQLQAQQFYIVRLSNEVEGVKTARIYKSK